MRLMGIQVLLIFISRQGLKGWVKNRRIGTLFMGKLISDISVLYRIRLKCGTSLSHNQKLNQLLDNSHCLF